MKPTIVSSARERVLTGILLTSVGYFLFSLQDASIKLMVVGFSVWQILFFRSATIVSLVLAIGGRKVVADTARSPVLGAMLLRSFVILSAWLCFYTAARDLQLAELTTIYFAAPVVVTLLSIWLLGEVVPPVRWVAVFTGFVGVFIACNPVRIGFSLPVILVLAAACLWALAIVLMRKIALGERTLVQLMLNNCFFLIIAGLPMIWFWQTPGAFDLALLVGTGAVGGMGQYALFEGMRRAEASVVASFEYTSLIWAFALGWLIWNDVPRIGVFAGAILIFAAGVIIILAERRRA
ncbi:DMT family transporter [Aquibium oceanicum]|uniref:EamA family transporter n=1 Tax=Aquibium oceanicum TaxID=1670800 RepID=A0A1L3SQW3_9HYPH|nr:DMT family transporter [Aquibium oceanicum]APH71750.1 EamA family transporter [Aquibium oceanicum]